MPIFIRARAMPMVRTNRTIRDICTAKTCSAERTFERAALGQLESITAGEPVLLFLNLEQSAIAQHVMHDDSETAGATMAFLRPRRFAILSAQLFSAKLCLARVRMELAAL